MQVSDKLPDIDYVARIALTDDQIIAKALNILAKRMKKPGALISNPSAGKDWLRLHIGNREEEHFVVMFLDVKHRLIAAETMFHGSLTQTSVYPREVTKAALRHNAAAVMLAHNHPSGSVEPSDADIDLTRVLSQALSLVDIRVLDHFIASGDRVHSFAEHGQL